MSYTPTYVSHPHQFDLVNCEDHLYTPLCSVCHLKASGWVFSCKRCNFFLHSLCSYYTPPQIQHPIKETNVGTSAGAATSTTPKEDKVRASDGDSVPLHNIDDHHRHQYNDGDKSTDDCLPLQKMKKAGDDADHNDIIKVPMKETMSSGPVHSLDDSNVVTGDHTDNDVTDKDKRVIEVGTNKEVVEELQVIEHGTSKGDLAEELQLLLRMTTPFEK